MKSQIVSLINQALASAVNAGVLPDECQSVFIGLEATKDPTHGDLASNLAMLLAKPARKPPRAIAEAIVAHLPANSLIRKVDIAGPGFINFHVDRSAFFQVIPEILEKSGAYGKAAPESRSRVQVEFVSANPTGPLHVGHGRGAAYGDSLGRLLTAAGYQVHKEYYVNDAGRQMNILATSVWLRYLELSGQSFRFPSNGYKGQYVVDIARSIEQEQGDRWVHSAESVFRDIPADEPNGGDKEIHIDALIGRCRELLGEDAYERLFDAGLESIRTDIEDDLREFGVTYGQWFSERSIQKNIPDALERLKKNGHIYEQDGAQWFRSTTFGDDKDRVVVRANGDFTYFASDIAYHLDKYQRGFDRIINVWGADHHGYIPRVKAALTAMGLDAERLDVKLVQFAILYRGTERVQMSTRSGSFVTLRELREEVGNDAARFFYVTRKTEQHMDFDLELAKSESKDNPVYYIQYAHARICSVQGKLSDTHTSENLNPAELSEALSEDIEKQLCVQIARFPELVLEAAEALEPHQITHYLRELAGNFHSYYNSHKVLCEDSRVQDARLKLSLATRQVLANGLSLLGVSAPEHM